MSTVFVLLRLKKIHWFKPNISKNISEKLPFEFKNKPFELEIFVDSLMWKRTMIQKDSQFLDSTLWIPDWRYWMRDSFSGELGFRISTGCSQFTNWGMKKLIASCFTKIISSLKTPSEIYCWQQKMVCQVGCARHNHKSSIIFPLQAPPSFK